MNQNRREMNYLIMDVLNFLDKNGVKVTFESNQKDGETWWYVYINWTNRFISIHTSYTPKQKQLNSRSVSDYLIDASPNGGWIGPFENFAVAYCFASLLRRAIFFKSHKEYSLNGVGLTNIPYKFL